MLTCLVIAGSLWIGDESKMFPTQGAFYFHKFQQTIKIYGVGGDRHGSLIIPKEYDGDTIMKVFNNCVDSNE
tara:strand:- start:153 stop:368 length:216 start_codon:yes stop_codon:yes gene_type:complete